MEPNKETKLIEDSNPEQLAFMLELSTTSIEDVDPDNALVIEYFTGYSILVPKSKVIGVKVGNTSGREYTCEEILKDLTKVWPAYMPTIVNEHGGTSFAYIVREMKPSAIKNMGIVLVDESPNGDVKLPVRPITIGRVMNGILDGVSRAELGTVEYWFNK